MNGLQGSFVSSDIFISWSDDGGRTWTTPRSIAVTPSELHVPVAPGREGSTACDENQFSIPETARNGDLYIHFQNFQNEAAWEVDLDFDSQILVIRSTDGGETFGPGRAGGPARGRTQRHAVVGDRQADGLGPPDPVGVGRQHLREPEQPARRHRRLLRPWQRRTRTRPMPASLAGKRHGSRPTTRATPGPNSNTNVYISRSLDGGVTWTGRQVYDAAPATSGSRGPTTSPTGRSPWPGTRTSSRQAGRRPSTTSSSMSSARPAASRRSVRSSTSTCR